MNDLYARDAVAGPVDDLLGFAVAENRHLVVMSPAFVLSRYGIMTRVKKTSDGSIDAAICQKGWY